MLTAAQLESIASKSAFDDVARSALADAGRKAQFEQMRAGPGGAYDGPSTGDDAQLRAEMLQWQAYKQTLATRYLPGHPDADAQGYVAFPRISPAEEMVDLMGASRAYQTNVNAMLSVRDMIQRSIDLLR